MPSSAPNSPRGSVWAGGPDAPPAKRRPRRRPPRSSRTGPAEMPSAAAGPAERYRRFRRGGIEGTKRAGPPAVGRGGSSAADIGAGRSRIRPLLMRFALAQTGRDRRQACDIDAVLGSGGDQRQRIGAFAQAHQRPQQGRARAAAAMRDDRDGGAPQYRGEGVDIGARQDGRGDRYMMIGHSPRRGEAPGGGGGKLAGVFAVGAVVDDRAHPGAGQSLDIGRIEPPGGAEPRGERDQ